MSGQGYTFATVVLRPGEPAQVRVSLYLDHRAWMCVTGTDASRPSLTVEHGDVTVAFRPLADQATPQDAQLARQLADHAATWAAEIERLSNRAAPDGGTTDVAAGDPAA